MNGEMRRNIKNVMNVCFVSEHGPNIGDGHISRQYAIAEWLAENAGNNLAMDLFTNDLCNPFVEKFKAIGARTLVVDIKAVDFGSNLNREDQYKWCFVDGDQISNEAERLIKRHFSCKTIRVSDRPVHYRYSDVLINQNYNSEHFTYENVPGQKRYFGLKHVILRKIIREAVSEFPEEQKGKLITISLGNSVSDEICAITRKLIEYLSDDSFDEFNVNIFTNNPIEAIQAERSHENIKIRMPSDDFIESIRRSEFVICSVGTTMWECMSLGTPYVVIPLNDAQSEYAEVLQKDGICISMAPDTVLKNTIEIKRVLDRCLDQRVQGEYKLLYKKLLPLCFFEALEEILEIGRRPASAH